MLAHLGAMLAHLGDMLVLSRPMLLDGHGRSGGAESIIICKVKVRPGSTRFRGAWVGGRGSSYITFGYQPKASGKDTGAWPAPGFKGRREERGGSATVRHSYTMALVQKEALAQGSAMADAVAKNDFFHRSIRN